MHNRKRFSLTQLHRRTGAVIQEVVAKGAPVIVTDHGRPVAAIVRLEENQDRLPFRDRVLLPAFKRAQKRRIAGDSAISISADRERF